MATRASQFRHQSSIQTISWPWLRELIRLEVVPYPGRASTVIRMTIAATLVMIIVVTFRIPNATLAGLFSMLLARENLAVTWRGGQMIVLGFVVASLYTLLGMMLFRGYPLTHFFWVIGSLYLIFFVIRTTTNYAATLAFVIPIGVALPVWDRPLPSEVQVEGTLWPVLIVAVGAGATLLTEFLYRIFDRSDPLIIFGDDLLLAVQQVTESVANEQVPSEAVLARVHQYQRIGTGRLRMTLQRQGADPSRRAQRAALISLAGRLIDLAANLARTSFQPSADDAIRLRNLSARLGSIRTELRKSGGLSASYPLLGGAPSSILPMLQEMEQTVALFPEVFQREEMVDGSKNAPGPGGWRALFLPDAFQNPEYLRFALSGCTAASICYFLYNALDWPGISTSVLTCVVTALGTTGSSVQAQFLRLAGFVVGGLILGISAQILILPGIDSIFGFSLFFAAATAFAAWFATSSPRLSFFGVQVALAFFFVNLQDFRIQTDLTIARDKVVGVLLGIVAMGFVFNRVGAKSDAEQLQKLLVRNVRMLAQLGVRPAASDPAIAGTPSSRLRIQINDNFASLEAQTDAVRFESEFRQRRQEDLAECERIQRAQPALRSIYLMKLSLLAHRRRLESASGLTEQQTLALDQFLNETSKELLHIAAWITGEEAAPARMSADSLRQLQQSIEKQDSPVLQRIADICQKMFSVLLILRNECN
jgi:multidrug resistance protein MdtO